MGPGGVGTVGAVCGGVLVVAGVSGVLAFGRGGQDRLYQFDQLSRWLAREGLGVGEMTGEKAERFALERRTAAVVSWASPQSVALPLEYLRQLGAGLDP